MADLKRMSTQKNVDREVLGAARSCLPKVAFVSGILNVVADRLEHLASRRDKAKVENLDDKSVIFQNELSRFNYARYLNLPFCVYGKLIVAEASCKG